MLCNSSSDFYGMSNWGQTIAYVDVSQFQNPSAFDRWVKSLEKGKDQMTDLDRKIAELRGWRELDGVWAEPGVAMGICQAFANSKNAARREAARAKKPPSWSTDTAKAFELVDEVGLPFGLSKNHPINNDGDFLDGYYMAFLVDGVWLGQGTHPTMLEAICRAYIALKEWEGKR